MQIHTFNCPKCAAPIEFKGGNEKSIKCPFCGSTVIVPKELRAATAQQQQVVIRTLDGGAVAKGIFGLTGATLVIFIFVAVVTCGGLVIGGMAMWGGISTATSGGGGLPDIGPIEALTVEPTPGYATQVLSFGGEGSGPGLMEDARSIAVDAQGNIYTAEYLGGRVQQFDSSGMFVTQLLVDTKMPLPSIVADRNGVLYIVQAGKITRYQGASGSPLTDVTYPADVSFDDTDLTPDGGLITFAWNNRDDVVVLGADGTLKQTLEGAVSTISGDSELDGKVTMDGRGNIYVLGTFNNAVFKFGPDGNFLNRFGSQGSEPGEFTAPSSIAVDGQSRIYVTDFKGVQVFDENGRYLGVIDVPGAASGMAFDAQGALYVVARTMVYKFTIP